EGRCSSSPRRVSAQGQRAAHYEADAENRAPAGLIQRARMAPHSRPWGAIVLGAWSLPLARVVFMLTCSPRTEAAAIKAIISFRNAIGSHHYERLLAAHGLCPGRGPARISAAGTGVQHRTQAR